MKKLHSSLFSASGLRACLGALVLLAGILTASGATKQPASPPRGFLGQATDTTTGVHDHPGWTGVTQGAEKAEEAFKKALENSLATAEKAENFKKLGKYVKILDYGLKLIKFGDLGVQGVRALHAGDKRAFREIFNKALREAIKTGAGMAGAAGGAALGTAAGGAVGGALTLPAGGAGGIVTGAIGAFAGGWLGDFLGSEGAAAVYDYFLQNWVKNNLADAVFDAMSSGSVPPPGGGGGSGGAADGPLGVSPGDLNHGGGGGGGSHGGGTAPQLRPLR